MPRCIKQRVSALLVDLLDRGAGLQQHLDTRRVPKLGSIEQWRTLCAFLDGIHIHLRIDEEAQALGVSGTRCECLWQESLGVRPDLGAMLEQQARNVHEATLRGDGHRRQVAVLRLGLRRRADGRDVVEEDPHDTGASTHDRMHEGREAIEVDLVHDAVVR